MKMRFIMTAAVLSAVCLLVSDAQATLIPAITADALDAEPYDDGTVKWSGQSTASVGTSGGTPRDGHMAYPFALPTLPVGEVVTEATLTFQINSINSFNPGDLPDMNVYGLRSSASPTVFHTDYALPGATLLEASVEDQNGVTGLHSTSASFSLGSWIQSLYDGGAVAGEFAFISLGTAAPPVLASRNYGVDTANGAVAPTLSITTEVVAIPEPSSLALVGLGFLMTQVFRKKA